LLLSPPDGAIVQEHTLYGLDGLAPAGTIQPPLGRNRDALEPRLGVLMNPYIRRRRARRGNCLSVSRSTTRLPVVNPASDKKDRGTAVHNRDLVASKMTPAQIAEAQRLAGEWKPQR
jgi:hypothetical protein